MDGQTKSRRGVRWRGRLVLLLAFLAMVGALFLTWGGGATNQVEAQVPSVDYSMEVVGVPGCSTKGGDTKCDLPVGSQFTVAVNLNNFLNFPDADGDGRSSYQAFQVRLAYAGDGLSQKAGTSSISWPGCVFGVPSEQPGIVLIGCAGGLTCSAPGDVFPCESAYTGVMASTSFNCATGQSTTNTVTLLHGEPFDTLLTDDASIDHAESGEEVLTINCVAPPTDTPTPTPTPTPTISPTPSPTLSPTPTVSPTPTLTPTPTPLPSERPDVTVTKTDSPDPVESNATITYTLLVRNLGVLTATAVQVVDTLPPETTFVSASPGCSHDAGVVTCDVGDLGPNDSAPGGTDEATLQIQVTAPTPVEDSRVANLATVSAENEDFAFWGNNKDVEETVVLAPRPDLVLEKADDPDPVSSGGAITYTLTVRNLAPREAENVVIEDTLPGEATFISASPACGAPVGGVVTCNLGNLAPGGQTAVQIQVAAPAVTQDRLITNSALVSADNELFSQTGNNSDIENTAVIAPAPDLALSKSDSEDPVLRTRYYSYTLTVSNLGGGDAKDVVVSDVLPKAIVNDVPQPVTFVDSKGAGCSPAGENLVQCAIPLVAANGGETIITLNVRAPTVLVDTILTNEATVVDPDEPDDPADNNSDSEPTQIQACFDVTDDALVTIADIVKVTGLFGITSADPRYDLLQDLDGSGSITIFDVVMVVGHFGQVC